MSKRRISSSKTKRNAWGKRYNINEMAEWYSQPTFDPPSCHSRVTLTENQSKSRIAADQIRKSNAIS